MRKCQDHDVESWCSESVCQREATMSAPHRRSFDGDGEEEGFCHERAQCVIMMSLEV